MLGTTPQMPHSVCEQTNKQTNDREGGGKKLHLEV